MVNNGTVCEKLTDQKLVSGSASSPKMRTRCESVLKIPRLLWFSFVRSTSRHDIMRQAKDTVGAVSINPKD